MKATTIGVSAKKNKRREIAIRKSVKSVKLKGQKEKRRSVSMTSVIEKSAMKDMKKKDNVELKIIKRD